MRIGVQRLASDGFRDEWRIPWRMRIGRGAWRAADFETSDEFTGGTNAEREANLRRNMIRWGIRLSAIASAFQGGESGGVPRSLAKRRMSNGSLSCLSCRYTSAQWHSVGGVVPHGVLLERWSRPGAHLGKAPSEEGWRDKIRKGPWKLRARLMGPGESPGAFLDLCRVSCTL